MKVKQFACPALDLCSLGAFLPFSLLLRSVSLCLCLQISIFFVLASGFDKQVMKEFWFLYCPHARELVLCIGVHGNVTLGFRT